jgi:hypothetical protein
MARTFCQATTPDHLAVEVQAGKNALFIAEQKLHACAGVQQSRSGLAPSCFVVELELPLDGECFIDKNDQTFDAAENDRWTGVGAKVQRRGSP